MKEKESRESRNGLTDQIREVSRLIVRNSREILTINYESVENVLAPRLEAFQAEPKTGPDPFADESLSPENELGLNLFLNVNNFCYKDPVTKKDYAYINKAGKSVPRATGFKAAMVESDINWGNTEEVSHITPKKWAEVTQLNSNKEFYLGAERGKRVAGFSQKLKDEGLKNVSEFLDFTDYDTSILLPVLAGTVYFQDIFQKRSQLAINMMNGVLKRRFNRELMGMDSLTVMADYRLPQLMYNFGAIELSESLKAKLMREDIIQTDSPEELALRGATVVIGEKLSDLMKIPEGQVDSLLWTLATDLGRNGKLPIPHMLVPTDKY